MGLKCFIVACDDSGKEILKCLLLSSTRILSDAFYQMFSSSQAFQGLLGGSDGKETACNARKPGLIPGSRRSPGGGNEQRSLVDCSPWGGKESEQRND